MNQKSPKVDAVLRHTKQWRDEFEMLRDIALDCGLTEDLKWYQPCYTLKNKNIVLIHGFKEYCALLFFKGALLKDPKRILIQQTENVQSGRQIRFRSIQEIAKLKHVLKSYIHDAIEVEKAGLKVKLKKTADYKMPDELQKKLDRNRALKTAFEALTPGRQRGYIYHFSQPKQSKTREARVERCIPQILGGKGLND